jgi:hypothetical protein
MNSVCKQGSEERSERQDFHIRTRTLKIVDNSDVSQLIHLGNHTFWVWVAVALTINF